MFGKSDALKKAKEQRKIDKMKLKTEKEKLSIEAKRARNKVRETHGGVGASISFRDRDEIPEYRRKGRCR